VQRAPRVPAGELWSELAEEEELVTTAPERIAGCIRSVIEAQNRLVAVLQESPARSTKAILLEQARWSAERFADQLQIELHRHRAAAWRASGRPQ